MRLFCCKPRFQPESDPVIFVPKSNSVIFVDVDGTLISSFDNTLNRKLCEALRGQTIVLLTSMSMREVQERVINPTYITRKSLIKRLEEDYDITVSQVIIPVDLAPDMKPGDGYKDYIEVWTAKAETGELNASNLVNNETYQAACQEFTKKLTVVDQELGKQDSKGLLVKKFFDQPVNSQFANVYFLEDREACIIAVTAACEELEKPYVMLQVKMKGEPQSTEFYIQSLNAEPHLTSAPTERSGLLAKKQ